MRWLMTRWGHGQRSEGATTVDKFILWLKPFLFHSPNIIFLLVSFPITSTIHLLLKTEILWTILGAGKDLQLHLHLPSPFGWQLSSTLFVYFFGWSQTPSQLHRWHLNPVRGKEEGCSIRSRLAGGYKEASLTELSQSMPSGVLSSKIDCFILSPDTWVHIGRGEE